MELRIEPGDITEQSVDAIVNAANSTLLGGGGVDGAIHRRGGPEILAECRRLRETELPDGLPAGQAIATTAGRLSARWVIHTVGPVYAKTIDHSETLASCYRESLRVAARLGARSVAFPAISAGVYGWPMDDAARIAVQTCREMTAKVGPDAGPVTSVVFIPFSDTAARAFHKALEG
ncbi:O-acetyl-ADP-ribose deacetylase [Citricoccus alkalitolerans]|uniref:O-acetyl-ADP-ribose deacetylase n=1 Tax=Citricoccus alkalitolerans TaxID=246603 RepID=A0ABV8XUH3_9MICC